MKRLTPAALGFTEDDVWREIRDRWRRPAGEPKTDDEVRRLFRAEDLEEVAALDPDGRLRLAGELLRRGWGFFKAGRRDLGLSDEDIRRDWFDDDGVDLGPPGRLLGLLAPILEAAGIPYALIGGVADFVVALDTPGEAEVARRLEGLGFEVRRYGGPGAPMARWLRVIQLGTDPPLKADLIVATDELWRQAIRRARVEKVGGSAYPVATPEDLILLKLKAGRLQDLFDAASVMKVQGLRRTPVDLAYLDREAGRWGVGEPWRRLREAMKE